MKDPYIRIAYHEGTAKCVPEQGGLRDGLFDIASKLYLENRPLPENWPAIGIPYKPQPDVDLKVITDFVEQEHEGKLGVRFKAEGTVAGEKVDVTFSISKEQLEVELKTYEAFGGGMHCHVGPIRLA